MPANPNLILQTPTNPGVALWGPGGGATVDVEDEGAPLGPADTFDFVGAGVTVVVVGDVATVTIPGGGAPGTTIEIEDEGVPQGPADTINFVGAGITAVVAGTTATVTVPGAGTPTIVLQDEGVPLGPIDTLNFIGAGVTAAILGATGNITIPGGGAGASPFVATNEWFVDNTAVADAAMRIFPTIPLALADITAVLPATEAALLRLREGQTHPWDGTALPTDRPIEIYSEGSQTATLAEAARVEFALATSLLTDSTLVFKHVNLDCNTNTALITLGAANLTIEECGGQFDIQTTDQPTPVTVQGLEFYRSYMDLVHINITAANTTGFSLLCQDCQITCPTGTTFIDASAGVASTFVSIFRSELIFSGGPGFVFLSNAGDFLSAEFVDSLLSILGGGVTIWSGGSAGPVWTASRIVANDSEAGGNWFFGEVGQAIGLSIENYAPLTLLPTDAPGNTIARSQEYGGLFFKRMVNDPAQSQWRGDGDKMFMTAGLGGAAPVTDILISIIDATDTIFFDPTTKKTFRITGSIIFSVTGATDDTTVLNVDVTVRVSAAAATVLAGGTTVVYEDNVGRYTATMLPVVNSGLQIQVDKTTGANSPQIRADLTIAECPTTP